jgi:hypothetical protein
MPEEQIDTSPERLAALDFEPVLMCEIKTCYGDEGHEGAVALGRRLCGCTMLYGLACLEVLLAGIAETEGSPPLPWSCAMCQTIVFEHYACLTVFEPLP